MCKYDCYTVSSATFVVAASDSLHKKRADYICSSTNFETQMALAIGTGSRKIVLMEGNYVKSTATGIDIPSNTEIELLAGATIKLKDGINADSYIFKNLDFSDGNENIFIKGGGKLDCNSGGQSSGVYRAIHFENVTSGTIDIWIENHNHLEYKMKNCGTVDFINRMLMRPPLLIHDCDSLDNLSGGTLSEDRVSGTHSIQVTAAAQSKTLTNMLPSVIDARYRQLKVWLKFDNIDNLDRFTFLLGGPGDTIFRTEGGHSEDVLSSGVWYPLLMSYTGFGHWDSGASLKDWENIRRVMLKVYPKTGKTVVVNIDKIELVSIPPKPVLTITFDDGMASQLEALPILEKYGAKAGIGVVLNRIGGANAMTLAELQHLKRAGWDMLSHTISHPDLMLLEESKQDQELIQSKALLDSMGLGLGSDFFIVPFHNSNGAVLRKIRSVYTNARSTFKSNPISYTNAYDPFGERPQFVLDIDGHFLEWPENAAFRHSMVYHDWVVCYGHGVDGDMKDTLEALASYCYEQGIPIKTFSEIYHRGDSERHTSTNSSVSDLFMDTLAASASAIHAAITGTGAEQEITTAITNPDVPRNVSITNSANSTGDVVITGIDAKGIPVTDTITISTGGIAYGVVAFSTVSKITIPATVVNPDTISVGMSNKLGFSNIIYATGDVYKIKKNNANATVADAQVNTTYDTYDMSVIGLGAADDFTIWYKSNLNIFS